MQKTRIFIVEDDADILHLLTYNIQSAGFDVQTATDGHAALAGVRQYQPHLVVLDLMIPGIEGF